MNVQMLLTDPTGLVSHCYAGGLLEDGNIDQLGKLTEMRKASLTEKQGWRAAVTDEDRMTMIFLPYSVSNISTTEAIQIFVRLSWT